MFKLLKWICLGVIGYFAVKLIDVSEIQAGFDALPAPALVLFLSLMLLARIQYALRWKLLSAGVGIVNLPTVYLLRVGLLSEFVSIVLPSYLGGDGLRMLKLRPYTDNNHDILVSILVDRATGVLTLAALTAVFLPFLASYAGVELPLPTPLAAGAIGALILFTFALLYELLKRGTVRSRFNLLKRLSLNVRLLIVGGVISLFGHLIFASAYAVLFQHLTPVGNVSLLSIVLLALLSNSIPLSILGIEMSDGALIALAAAIGIHSRVTFLIIVLVVASRYLFGVAGILLELLIDGRQFFTSARLVGNNN